MRNINRCSYDIIWLYVRDFEVNVDLFILLSRQAEDMTMDTKQIGRFLKELRKSEKMTQEELGDRVGVTNKTISKWENGNYMPPIDVLMLLSEIYGVSINEILNGRRLEDA